MTPDPGADTFELIVKPLARRLTDHVRIGKVASRTGKAASRTGSGTGTHTLGICGSQGSGKSTLAHALTTFLSAQGLRCASLSLDDLYLTHAERASLGREVHPLLQTRGVPGTHDVGLGLQTLDALKAPGNVAIPRFDKSQDDRFAIAEWPRTEAPVDVIVFEGWCVGARPQPDWMLAAPVNALERDEDPDGRWRAYVNHALAGDYQTLFGRIDTLMFLQAPSFEVVHRWRREQEAALRRSIDGTATPRSAPLRTLSDADLMRFISHYERLTRWLLLEMPARADVTVELGINREVRAIHEGSSQPAC